MTTTVPASVALHLNKRTMTFVIPVVIVAFVTVISLLIALVFWRAGSAPGSPEWIEGMRSNGGLVWSLAGFMGYFGVQAVSTTFPFGMALGATRRGFVGGTLLWYVIVSAYLTAVYAVLLLLEQATNQWFAHLYLFDVHLLGGGELGRLVPIVFLGTLAVLSLGGAFGASWVRFGPLGPSLLGAAIVLVLLVALVLVVPAAGDVLAAFELWWLALLAGVVILGSAAASVGLLRGAAVR